MPTGLLLISVLAVACGDAAPEHPNVVVWLVDTLRADHLSCYGYDRETSPHFDALASRGVLFEEVHVHSNWTQPSVTSLLSARYPVLQDGKFTTKVPPDLTLAAEWFAAQGYATAGFTVTMAVANKYGFGKGFETYEELELLRPIRERKRREGGAFDADRVVDAALHWIDREKEDERPFLLYLHTVDPHEPYEPHEGGAAFGDPYDGPFDGSIDSIHRIRDGEIVATPRDIQHLLDLYDGEIAYNDREFGRLLDGLAERALLDDTLVVVLSDHGQEFWEHEATGHGHWNLHRELTHVPLIMAWPARLPTGHRVQGLVRGVDVLPTLLDLSGLTPLPEADGRSLAEQALGRGDGSVQADEVFVRRARDDGDPVALRTERWLLTYNPGKDERALFDLHADVAELEDVSSADQRTSDELMARLSAWSESLGARDLPLRERDRVELDPETREQLEALGYLR